MLKYSGVKITWMGHSGFKIKDDLIIYIDPLNLSGREPADMILITHEHPGHLSINDIKNIINKDTLLIVPTQAKKFIDRLPCQKICVRPGDIFEVEDVKIWAVPAYNINKFMLPGIVYHPREHLYIGYIIDVKGTKIYHAGDTDKIPEMRGIRCDIALLPVSGKCVMTSGEAAEAVKMIHPKITVPMHYGDIIGSLDDAKNFLNRLKDAGINAIILERK